MSSGPRKRVVTKTKEESTGFSGSGVLKTKNVVKPNGVQKTKTVEKGKYSGEFLEPAGKTRRDVDMSKRNASGDLISGKTKWVSNEKGVGGRSGFVAKTKAGGKRTTRGIGSNKRY